MQFNPKITIVTVVFNGKSLIERTIKSVLSQSYTNTEYIIIDGASSDGTLEIAEKYQSQIALLLSGKDDGIYDAMNKGLKHATGDYILFLNAGDEFFSAETLSQIFALGDADVYYGNTAVVDETGKALGDRRLSPPEVLTWKSLKFGMCVSHQSFIAKLSLCENYNLNYLISADIDWVISVLKKAKKITNTKNYISKFLEGGTSNKRRKKALGERFAIMSKQYGFIPTVFNHFYILLRYPFHKLFKKSMT
ncbi:glycosyltransferase family 2 protein [soil metagenome]